MFDSYSRTLLNGNLGNQEILSVYRVLKKTGLRLTLYIDALSNLNF